MSSKIKQKIDMKSIKEYEKAQRAKSQPQEDRVLEVSFDQWWADKASSLKLAHHMKEIVRADFRGRGLVNSNTLEKWDWAAKQFGLNV